MLNMVNDSKTRWVPGQARRNESIRKLPLGLSLLLALALADPISVQAEETVNEGFHLDEAGAHEAHHRHHVGLFFGGVSRFEQGHEETGGALGVEYEYRLAPRWGLGGLVEGVAVGGGRDLALVVPLSWHPWRGLKFSVGPGVELHEGNGEFLGRVSVGYDFHLGHFTLAPEVSGDFTREAQSLVYGLTFGCGF